MNVRRLAFALWITFAFVTWNVVFDRSVADAAVEVTRDQILRYQQGAPVGFIESAFSPRVREAAVKADLYAACVLLCGAVVSRMR
jgi:hypothetical protein